MSKKGTKLRIEEAILLMFKSGDKAKVYSFFSKVRKAIKDQQKTVKANYEQEKIVDDNKLEKLKDRLEDAKEAYEDAFLALDLDSIQTKDSQRKYVDTYLLNLKHAEEKVQQIEDEITQRKDSMKDKRDEKNLTLKSLDEKLTQIESEIDISHLVEEEK